MESNSHSDITRMERDNWWYVSRREMIDSLLEKISFPPDAVALDVGCGVGSNLPPLRRHARTVYGLDISPHALAYAHQQGFDKLVEASAESIPYADETADIVTCMDVLEHLDDSRAMAEVVRVLKKKGTILITVPAFPSLWNENDDYGHHLRRYRKQKLKALIEHHGLVVDRLSYWNFLFFLPVWLVARFYRKSRANSNQVHNNLSYIPSFLNPLLIRLMRFERWISSLSPLPFGVSLYAVAHK